MAEQIKDAKAESVKISQGRSPAYPFISLEKAIERVEQVSKAGGTRQALPPETFYKIWVLGPGSSGARQTMAALNHFGLADYIGRGEARKVKISALGLKIVLDKQPDSKERTEAIRESALSPPIHRELFEKFGAMLPADVVLETYLTRDRGYTIAAAKNLVGEYAATLLYSGLDKPVDLPDDGGLDPLLGDEMQDTNQVSGRHGSTNTPPPVVTNQFMKTAGTEIANVRVAKDCAIRLLADGPYTKRSIEALVKQLQLGLELGTYDDEEQSNTGD